MKRGIFMERTMSVEDKIRRAEEIYNKRRENEYRVSTTRVSVDNNKNRENTLVNKRLKRMIVQIILCMTIYFVFYYIINNNYAISGDFKNKCREILSYDISFSEMYKKISTQVTSIKEKYQQMIENVEQDNNEKKEEEVNDNKNVEANSEEENEEQNIEQKVEENNVEKINEELEPQANIEENIGGPTEEIENAEPKVEQETQLTEEEQMKKDSEEIKERISFIKPVEGIVTSNFGWRNPKSSTVSKYHTGIDIGAEEGTNIISATNGKVVLASSEGSYGNHLKIQIEDIAIIYAHCLSLEVKEGDEIIQGQIIAKVGSTGNSTGPHLHFEVRRDERYVDPKLILDF